MGAARCDSTPTRSRHSIYLSFAAKKRTPIGIPTKSTALRPNIIRSLRQIVNISHARIIAGLPGAEEYYTLDMFRSALAAYRDLGHSGLRINLASFIQSIAPTAAEVGVRLCIHPDDPPFPLLGLPRIMSTAADVEKLFAAADVPANGLTFCTGSFGVRRDNDLLTMVRAFGPRVYFAHLRSTRREPSASGQPSFHEADHLDGDVDMVAVIRELLREERRRKHAGEATPQIPMRPDHGHQMLDDLHKKTNPGYSAIGRLRGLAEIRGVARAIEQFDGSMP